MITVMMIVTYNPEDRTFTGWVITYPKYVQKYQQGAEVKMFVAGEINKKAEEAGTFISDKQFKDVLDQKGEGAGIYLRFKTEENEAIEIKAGFSYTSAANALANLNAEAENLTFDETEILFDNNLNLLKYYLNNINLLQTYKKLAVKNKKDEWIKFLDFWIKNKKNNEILLKKDLEKFKKTEDKNLLELIRLIIKNIK